MLIIVESDNAKRLRVEFRLTVPRPISAELQIALGPGDESDERALCDIARMIENARHSVLESHCEECNWHQVMAIVRHCHTALAHSSSAAVKFNLVYEASHAQVMAATAEMAAGLPVF